MTPTISFEIFPPATADGLASLRSTVAALSAADPSFVSVTYGAGGSNRDRSFAAIDAVLASTPVGIAGHLTCVGQSRQQVLDVVDRYALHDVHHVVALRGDPPGGVDAPYEAHPDGFRSTAELVDAITSVHPATTVAVSAYPERHPQSPSFAHDLAVLADKVDAGATQAITQMCFDTDALLAHRDRIDAHGIDVQLIPGIFPIHSVDAVSTFAARCGAVLPAGIRARFAEASGDPLTEREVAADVAAEQILRLAENGIEHAHIYTLNKADLALSVCERLAPVPA